MTFNWPENSERYKKVARFVDAFFGKIDEFQKPPRHPKWDESSIVATNSRVATLQGIEDWLIAHNLAQSAESDKLKVQKFLTDNRIPGGTDPAKREELFRQFQEWQKRQRPPL